MNALQKFNHDQLQILKQNKEIPYFSSGDTIRVGLKITDGTTERVQLFEGVVLGRKNKGINSSCLVRKVTDGIGIEKNIKIYSPKVMSIELIRYGKVRRAKIYYLRKLTGKQARIPEDLALKNKFKKLKEEAKKAAK